MQLNPSILSADFANLEAELQTISAADAVHVDVMDNHFVPNLTFGLQMVKRLQEVSEIPLDVHLMIENVDRLAIEYAQLGVASVTFHLEASQNPVELARNIRETGCKVGVALKPGTDLDQLHNLLSEVDLLLVMTVEPGFGGQQLIPSMLEKISEAKKLISANPQSVKLQVDGGVTAENIYQLALAGAEVFVAGSSVFGKENRNLEINNLRALAQEGGLAR
jgi:ribulose-phosphate 3-epimerase